MLARYEYWGWQLDALEKFILSWFPKLWKIKEIDPFELVAFGLPSPLARFLAFIGSYNPNICEQNFFLKPDQMDLERQRVVFYVEKQYVYEWAFDKGKEDPNVYIRMTGPKEPWRKEKEPLSIFLCQACIFEAIMAGPFHASCICSIEKKETIVARWIKAPFKPWQWPVYPTEYYHASNALMVVNPNCENTFDIWCAGKQPEDLAFMQDLFDGEWAY